MGQNNLFSGEKRYKSPKKEYICCEEILFLPDMKKIAIAVDSFKGSLTSRQVADAFAEGFSTIFEQCEILKISVADGGEGTLSTLVEALQGRYVEMSVADPLMRSVTARYGLVDDGKSAIVEMAAASGLVLLEAGERNPMKCSSYGTGELIADALRRGARRILLCIGGSATNDAGVGMLRALGFRFLDQGGRELAGRGEDLRHIVSIDARGVMPELFEAEFVVACDVTNPLYGEQGAAYVYAPQKGADSSMVECLDSGLRNFAELLKEYSGNDVAMIQGAGAAGGLAAGAVALLGAHLERGVDMVLDAIGFHDIIRGSDLVITGEGRIDSQTFMGKLPCGVLRAASAQSIPAIAICGVVEECEALHQSGFAAIIPLLDNPSSFEEAMREDIATRRVKSTAKHIAKLMQSCRK